MVVRMYQYDICCKHKKVFCVGAFLRCQETHTCLISVSYSICPYCYPVLLHRFHASFSQDLLNIGVTALGPRKRIVHALSELRKGSTHTVDIHTHVPALSELRKQSTHGVGIEADASKAIVDDTSKLAANKLITDYFPGSVTDRSRGCISSGERKAAEKIQLGSSRKQVVVKNHARSGKLRDLPLWCCIPGTPFRVVSGISSDSRLPLLLQITSAY